MNPAECPTSLIEAVQFFGDEENCHTFVASLRWPEVIACPHCESRSIGKLVCSVAKSRSKLRTPGATFKRRLWVCRGCRKQFTVKTGTIFQDSPIGLNKWLVAVWLMTNAKNGISSYEVARSLGIRQKAAWFMCHRIRTAMREGTFEIAGEAEADEVYLGGQIRRMSVPEKQKRYGHRKPTGHCAKQPVLGILQRSSIKGGSRVILEQVAHAGAKDMGPHLLKHIKPGTWLYTDSHPTYRAFATHYIHAYVNHAVEYAYGRVHTNGLENFWSLLRRTLGGTYVRVLPVHLIRYLDEQACRFNERRDDDRDRFLSTMQRTVGRRLPWAALTGEGAW